MKLYELAKQQKKTSKELMAELDDPRIKSHLSTVPEDILAEFDVEEKKIETEPQPTQTVDSAETVIADVVVEEKEECPYTLKQIEMGCKLGGNKSKTWQWRHLIG